MAISSRLFSICPRISSHDGKLIAMTAWRLRFLMLGSFYRRVVVDPKQKELTIDRQYCWVFPRHYRVLFSDIEAVTYGYQDWAIGASLSWAHDSFDVFTVGLKMHDGEEWHLFSFFGGGTFGNEGPLPDWMYWEDYLLDTSGTQESESHAFVELLSKMIGVSVAPSSYS